MNDSIPNELLDRWLSGEASVEERATVQAWIDADPARAALIGAFRTALGDGSAEAAVDVEAALGGTWKRIERDTVAAGPRRFTAARAPVLMKAAVLATLLIGGWSAWQAVRARTGTASVPFPAVVTAAGQRDTVVLPDGSTAVLAPSSSLTAAVFDDTARVLDLAGEAFFSVVSDEGRPFRVRSGGAVTEVLGTEFTVRARSATTVTVAVRDGRVALSSGRDSRALTLSPGQVGRVVDGGTPELLPIEPDALLAWLDGVLEFDGDPLPDVIAELSRWIGRDVRLADSALAVRRVTGRFVMTSPEQALDALALALATTWAVRDSAYVIGSSERQ